MMRLPVTVGMLIASVTGFGSGWLIGVWLFHRLMP